MKNEGETRDSGALSAPLSFLRGGAFYWLGASLINRGSNGHYWSLRSTNTTNSYLLNFDNTYLLSQSDGNRSFGFAMRCVPTP